MTPEEALARSDAAFDGWPFDGLPRHEKLRYLERATAGLAAVTQRDRDIEVTAQKTRHFSGEVTGYSQYDKTVTSVVWTPIGWCVQKVILLRGSDGAGSCHGWSAIIEDTDHVMDPVSFAGPAERETDK